MSKFAESDVEKLAALARVEVTPAERAELAKDIEAILAYVSELDAVSADASERSKEALRNVVREDAVSHESGTFTERLLEAAPRAEKGYVAVKKVL